MDERISIITNELLRLEVLKEIDAGRLRQSTGARKLGGSQRQIRRLLWRFRAEGSKGVISRKVGASGNRRLSEKKKEQNLAFFQEKNHHVLDLHWPMNI